MAYIDHFSKQASSYAASRPTYPDELIDYISNLSGTHQKVLDCATGNGQAAVGLSQHFNQVVAFDRSFSQLSKSKKAQNIYYLCASTHALPIKNESLDLVVAAQAWHWFDKLEFENEVARVLRPGGHLAIWGYNLIKINEELDRLILHFYQNIVGDYWPEERRLLESKYKDFPIVLTPIPAPEFEMVTRWDRNHLFRYFRSWSATQRYISAKGDEAIKNFELALSKLWPVAQVTKTIHWPLFLKVAQRST